MVQDDFAWKGMLLAALVLLVITVILAVRGSAAYAFNMTTVVCDGNVVKFANGSLGCVDCVYGTVFNNVTGGCDLPASGFKVREASGLMRIGERLFPENPSLGALSVVGAGLFVGWRLLKVLKS